MDEGINMILPKQHIKNRNLIDEIIGEEQHQQAGTDVTLQKIFKFSSPGKVDFNNKERVLSECEQLEYDDNDFVFLPKGFYKVRYNEIIKIPSDLAAYIMPRSTMLRCGATLHSALWDPGYEGRGEGLLEVGNEQGMYVKKNARIGQIVFMSLSEETKELYTGQYKGENI
jgi:dUTP pyrophosphatase